ncbi:MAG: hypothetical protein DRI90_08550 [Deltaproteobacteria bacterium]|nr:MAG: hypothetical protein DRI90_08550 [Deltaproteobacteria bacterium]
MGYRDERESLRQRNQALEQELAAARRALSKDRGGGNLGLAEAPQRPPTGLIITAIVVLLAVGIALFRLGLMLLLPAVVALIVSLLLVLVASRVRVVRPGEALVLSGRQVRHADGSVSGCRIITAGRVAPMPLVEQVEHLDLRPFLVELRLSKVPCKGGATVTIQGVSLARIGIAPELLVRAAERFLGLSRRHVQGLVGQSLTGTLRAAIAHFTPAQVAAERERLSQSCLAEAELGRLGIEVMSLRILTVADDAGELDARGHQRLEQLRRERHMAPGGAS